MASGLDRALLEIDPRLRGGVATRDRDVLERYARDGSEVPATMPGAVIFATSSEEVAAVMKAASAHRVPVTPRASGTSRVGGAVPSAGGIVLSLERMTKLRDLIEDERIAMVEPGVVTETLHVAAEARGLFYAPDPSSLASCTLGGNIATNAAGARTFKYGVTREHVLGLEIVTGAGEVLKIGRRTRKSVAGYDVTALVVGSEGTLCVVTEATLALRRKPEHVRTMLALFEDEQLVPSAVHRLATSADPRCIELLDAHTLGLVRPRAGLPIPEATRAALLVEIDGDELACDRELERSGNALLDLGALDVLVAKNETERTRIWASRRELSHALRTLAKNKMSEDVVVPVPRLPALLETARSLAETYGIAMPAYGHAGDGNMHVNFLWNDDVPWARVHAAMDALMKRTLELGGTISGEHGIGMLKVEWLPLEQGPAVIALEQRIKQTFDPHGVLNPGKIFGGTRHGAC